MLKGKVQSYSFLLGRGGGGGGDSLDGGGGGINNGGAGFEIRLRECTECWSQD